MSDEMKLHFFVWRAPKKYLMSEESMKVSRAAEARS